MSAVFVMTGFNLCCFGYFVNKKNTACFHVGDFITINIISWCQKNTGLWDIDTMIFMLIIKMGKCADEEK